jgi:hypothetical protein
VIFGSYDEVKAQVDAAVLEKIGPHGYTHGWVFHGVPGSKEHADVLGQMAHDLAKTDYQAANHIANAGVSMRKGDLKSAKDHLERYRTSAAATFSTKRYSSGYGGYYLPGTGECSEIPRTYEREFA